MPKIAIAIAALLYAAPLAFAQEALEHEAHHPAPVQGQPPETSPGRATDGQGGMGGMPCPMMRGMMGQGMMGQGMMNSGSKGDQSASSIAFDAIRMKMGRDMAITYTGDADADFLKAMEAHHQGAIDMARTVLVFGKDPEVRKLAEAIVKQQESEIATMKSLASKPR